MMRVAIDAGVWVESILKNSRYFKRSRELVRKVLRGEVLAVIPHTTATEVYYVSLRVYKRLGFSDNDASSRAKKLFDLLFRCPNIKVASSEDIALLAGEIKARYKISLAYSYLLATSKVEGAVPVFRELEKEMEGMIDELRREFGIIFISEMR